MKDKQHSRARQPKDFQYSGPELPSNFHIDQTTTKVSSPASTQKRKLNMIVWILSIVAGFAIANSVILYFYNVKDAKTAFNIEVILRATQLQLAESTKESQDLKNRLKILEAENKRLADKITETESSRWFRRAPNQTKNDSDKKMNRPDDNASSPQ